MACVECVFDTIKTILEHNNFICITYFPIDILPQYMWHICSKIKIFDELYILKDSQKKS